MIVVKVKSKYWICTHKFGLKVPKSVTEAIAIYLENGDTLWWDAISKEMKNVRIAFEEFEGENLILGFYLRNYPVPFSQYMRNPPCKCRFLLDFFKYIIFTYLN